MVQIVTVKGMGFNMKKLLVATNNQGKVSEIKKIFSGIYDEVLSFKDMGIKMDTVEDGDTFAQNARKKAVEAFEATGMDCLADDSGLCVDALDGAPGIFSARFSGQDATDEKNNDLLIEKLRDVDEKDRTGHFACAICYVKTGQDGSMQEIGTYGEFHGVLLTERAGKNGFGYDPLFFVPKYNMTSAELSPEVKNKISHRAKALQELKRILVDE